MTIEITFAECEHSGDLNMYAAFVRQSGGTVTTQRIDRSAYETGIITATVSSQAAFEAALNETDASGFVQSIHSL